MLIITQQEFLKLIKIFLKYLILKTYIFQSQLETFTISKKKNSISISVFGYENKEKYPVYVSKQCCQEKHVDLLLIGEGEKKHVLIKDFNRFKFDHSLHRGRKHFCCYCLHVFIREEILEHHTKGCFKINDKQMIKMPKNGEYVKFKNFEKKKKNHHS